MLLTVLFSKVDMVLIFLFLYIKIKLLVNKFNLLLLVYKTIFDDRLLAFDQYLRARNMSLYHIVFIVYYFAMIVIHLYNPELYEILHSTDDNMLKQSLLPDLISKPPVEDVNRYINCFFETVQDYRGTNKSYMQPDPH
jgi:hypothetical protein